ncbi:hypothetical protein HRW23_29080 [Streptomyces lunaelactis]|uniref:hypothetical protein n=1 Tax=Streptomyces lunaelactis TaxID=1535768 RepID=UPI001584A126|nr:hypothetical protein [Streptomyces lunaelactis]NUK35190.1 hypothetical protein [Streptomyces lunaelactis]NUK44592.1 hypothetical protein [Streptomyces lunaelactis]NUK50254.1 hypothetical protein [Streptomyces lunaelactis]NUK60864.1 hypothetical protein [Streptomyces lunaelactis]NUK64580.1 hypothetical protein [Streptomyces lunaelactis]
MPAFWSAAAGKLVERWVATGLAAAVFWLILVMAWAAGRPRPRQALAGRLDAVGAMRIGEQIALLLVVLVVLSGSGLLMRQLTLPALRLLEGYWPGFLSPLSGWLRVRHVRRRAAASAAWNPLHARLTGDPSAAGRPPLSAEERRRYARLEAGLRWSPREPELMMPTRAGNILRAAEAEPLHKYGLDAVLLWPHLWTLLPESFQQNLSAARQRLDNAVAAGLWSLLVLPAVYWTPWALLALLAVNYAWRWSLPRACLDYAILLQAAFDLHRQQLYRALRQPLPVNAAVEREAGLRLTAYVYRGSDEPTMVFESGT